MARQRGGSVSCRDGAGSAVVGAVWADRAILSEARQWPSADWVRADAVIYFLQHWFNLSNLAVKEALYDSLAMRCFVGIDLGREPVPDETTDCSAFH